MLLIEQILFGRSVHFMKKTAADETAAEYYIEKYKFVVENKFDEKGRKIDDILINLAVKDLTKTETYSKIDL
jgi:hypothetical protein